MTRQRRPNSALLLTDIQNDFLPGGALAVPDGDKILGPANNLIRAFDRLHLPIFLSRNFHPPDHISFKSQGGPWPPHCVAGTKGAELSPSLVLPRNYRIINKAQDKTEEQYSAYEGRSENGQTLAEILKEHSIEQVFLGGLALEYCVLNTAKDLTKNGIKTIVIMDATRSINAQTGDEIRALQELKSIGCEFTTSRSMVRKKSSHEYSNSFVGPA